MFLTPTSVQNVSVNTTMAEVPWVIEGPLYPILTLAYHIEVVEIRAIQDTPEQQ
jgi:hypothetical protein